MVEIQKKESFGAVINGGHVIDFNNYPCALPLDEALKESLIESDGCFICVNDSTNLVIKQDDKLYLFDSHARNANGLQDSNGCSIVIQMNDENHLYEHLCLFVKYDNLVQFEITGISIKIIKGKGQIYETGKKYKTCLRNNDDDNDRNMHMMKSERSDVEILMTDTPSVVDFIPVDFSLAKKLCNIIGINLKYCNKNSFKSNINVYNIGSPKHTQSIVGDGNCLFRALSYAITKKQKYHKKIREAIVNHILINACICNSFIYPSNVHDHVLSTKMSESNVWGTALEILAVAHLLSTDIYTYFEGKWVKYSAKQLSDKNIVNANAIYLFNVGNHYEVVINVYDNLNIRSEEQSDRICLFNNQQKRRRNLFQNVEGSCSKRLKLENYNIDEGSLQINSSLQA